MSKIIYYIGAGASYGKKNAREIINEGTDDERLVIHEGLPVVNEIGKCLLSFKQTIIDSIIDDDIDYALNNGYQEVLVEGSDVSSMRNRLVNDIDELILEVKNHVTIDTYAKKLHLTTKKKELKKLKNILCVFFVWMQLKGKFDQRYDTFLANILQTDLHIPKDVSVISWNYDSQLEISYKLYNQKETLPIYEKNVDGDFPELSHVGRIFKVNGSANFSDFSIINTIFQKNEVSFVIQLIYLYDCLDVPNSDTGITLHSHVSFAWENSERREQLIDAINKTTTDTESVVVIGYSFPYFNRELDRMIFRGMKNLKTIYIQDPNPYSVEPSLVAVLQKELNVKIEHIKDCTQFYLPRDL